MCEWKLPRGLPILPSRSDRTTKRVRILLVVIFIMERFDDSTSYRMAKCGKSRFRKRTPFLTAETMIDGDFGYNIVQTE
jgi:hypothetical protein